LIFVVKFSYPDEKDKNILEFAKTPPTDEPDLRDLSSYNFNYQYTGEKIIAPTKVFDDGIFTYLEFSSQNSEAPAIYSVDSEGFESLVNYRIAGKYMIVEKVSSQFTLRNGNSIVCVYNMNSYSNGVSKKTNLLSNNKDSKSLNSSQKGAENPSMNKQSIKNKASALPF
jgi:type IV secretion system protein VirB9